jgi:hypothetical protein
MFTATFHIYARAATWFFKGRAKLAKIAMENEFEPSFFFAFFA